MEVPVSLCRYHPPFLKNGTFQLLKGLERGRHYLFLVACYWGGLSLQRELEAADKGK